MQPEQLWARSVAVSGSSVPYDPEQPAILLSNGREEGTSELNDSARREERNLLASAAASTVFCSSTPAVPIEPRAVQAVRRLLERHDRYDVSSLIELLSAEFPDLPRDMRVGLVIGATSGAQKASQLHFLWSAFKEAENSDGRLLAKNAKRSLAAWNLGPREEPVFGAPTTVLTDPVRSRCGSVATLAENFEDDIRLEDLVVQGPQPPRVADYPVSTSVATGPKSIQHG
jgi:hypothetical protein